jgi:hypothetical protein
MPTILSHCPGSTVPTLVHILPCIIRTLDLELKFFLFEQTASDFLLPYGICHRTSPGPLISSYVMEKKETPTEI